ncbi:hypothetical protein AB0C77_12885 [Streptomyces sp. NPDC048629]|uniref:hypothetical protein n=1 Tax=Streptomyces sp. NPDC048629 TaxID=3154824 RepID=UPI00341F7C84
MDVFPPVTGTYPDQTRLPLVSLDEARHAVELLMWFEDETPEGRAAGDLARTLAARLPAD